MTPDENGGEGHGEVKRKKKKKKKVGRFLIASILLKLKHGNICLIHIVIIAYVASFFCIYLIFFYGIL